MAARGGQEARQEQVGLLGGGLWLHIPLQWRHARVRRVRLGRRGRRGVGMGSRRVRRRLLSSWLRFTSDISMIPLSCYKRSGRC